LSDKKQKEANGFDALVEKYHETLTEDDLKEFLTTRIDIVKDIYVWLLGAFISAGIVIASIRFGPTLGDQLSEVLDVLSLVLFFIVIAGVVITLRPLAKQAGLKTPFQYQAILFGQYLEAKKKLKELNSQTVRPPTPQIQASEATSHSDATQK